jgi:hypothetical protein
MQDAYHVLAAGETRLQRERKSERSIATWAGRRPPNAARERSGMEHGRQSRVASITIACRRAALPALVLPTLLGHGPDPMTVVRGTVAARARAVALNGEASRPPVLRTLQAPSVGRLPGARSIPLSSLGTRRGEIPSEPLVVLYGAEGLLAAGHANVFVLEGGFAAWRARGDDVER